MATKDDGGPAYPGTYLEEFNHTDPDTGDVMEVEHTFKTSAGMSLRDWFAGQAVTGLVARFGYHPQSNLQELVRDTYRLADAMLAERAKGGA